MDMGDSRVFLDINIGNAEKHAREVAEYERTEAFLQNVGPQVWSLEPFGRQTVQLNMTD